MISQYWVNQIPARPLSILIKSETGADMDLSIYDEISVVLLGSNNEEISLTGSQINTANKNIGKILFAFPTDRSLFKKKGDYVLQLKLAGTGKLDFTTTHTIRVRELGKVMR